MCLLWALHLFLTGVGNLSIRRMCTTGKTSLSLGREKGRSKVHPKATVEGHSKGNMSEVYAMEGARILKQGRGRARGCKGSQERTTEAASATEN